MTSGDVALSVGGWGGASISHWFAAHRRTSGALMPAAYRNEMFQLGRLYAARRDDRPPHIARRGDSRMSLKSIGRWVAAFAGNRTKRLERLAVAAALGIAVGGMAAPATAGTLFTGQFGT